MELAGAVYACDGALGGIAFCIPVMTGIKKSSGLGTFKTARKKLTVTLISVERASTTKALFSGIRRSTF